ncbi:MAG: DUF1622 domain-containing protein [Candidatus Babeliaceae bacterium]|jgi:uncharacterized membrane protein
MLIDSWLLFIREVITLMGVAVITEGAFYGIYHFVLLLFGKGLYTLNQIRLQFGNSIILGLEFLVGADIIGSVLRPDYYNVGILVILVVIRIILSYFLNRELRALALEK